MAQSITTFLSQFNGGTRLNRFQVDGSISSKGTNETQTFTEGAAGNMSHFHIRSASLPESILGEIPVNYRGRTIYLPGDRVYKPWNITILDETSGSRALFQSFHNWSNLLNKHKENTNVAGGTTPKASFAVNWEVKQLDSNGGATIKKFELKNCWPMAVGPIQLDMGQDNTLATFNVSLMFSHYKTIITDVATT